MPVDPVLREVEILRRPVLALPQLVQLPVVSRCDSPRSAEASSAGSLVAWKSVRCVRSLIRPRLLLDWPVSQFDAAQRSRRRLQPCLRPSGDGPAGRAPPRLARPPGRLSRRRPAARDARRRRRPRPARLRRVRPPRPTAREAYTAEAQAASVLGLIEELGLERPVLVGYDVGSRVARTIALDAPGGRSRAIVFSPPMPGIGERILAEAQREFWYQPFHKLPIADAADRRRAGRGAHATSGTSGSTGARPAGHYPPSASTSWSACTPGPARSPPASPGTARAPAASRPRSRSARPMPQDRVAPSPPRCCGPSTTRCSRPRGRTGRASSSPTSSSTSSRASATSRRWRRRTASPRLRSGLYAGDEHAPSRPRPRRSRSGPGRRPSSRARPVSPGADGHRLAPSRRTTTSTGSLLCTISSSARKPGTATCGGVIPPVVDRELDRHTRLLLVAAPPGWSSGFSGVGGARWRSATASPSAWRSASRSPWPRRRGRRRRRGGRARRRRRSRARAAAATSGISNRAAQLRCRSRTAPRGRAARRPRTRPSCACA